MRTILKIFIMLIGVFTYAQTTVTGSITDSNGQPLSGATVRLIGREDPILEVSDIRQDVPPEGKWDSMVKRVESDDQPSFTQEIRFSILPRVSVQSSGTVELKEQQLTVLDAALQKRFDKSRIKSYISSNVETVITLENTGTSEINVLRVLDDIPGIFDTPNTENISIEIILPLELNLKISFINILPIQIIVEL